MARIEQLPTAKPRGAGRERECAFDGITDESRLAGAIGCGEFVVGELWHGGVAVAHERERAKGQREADEREDELGPEPRSRLWPWLQWRGIFERQRFHRRVPSKMFLELKTNHGDTKARRKPKIVN